MHPLLPLTMSALFQAAVMSAAWLQQRWTRNAGWSDAFWSFGLCVAGVGLALAPVSGAAWPTARQYLVAALVLVWGWRLAAHIAHRSLGAREDARYSRLREEWGDAFQRRLFVFLMIQAAAGAFLGMSIFLAAHNPSPGLGLQDGLAVLVLATAILGEARADAELRRFRAAGSGGRVCDVGWWGRSRHPNYFFEWLGWCAYPLFAIDLAGGYPWGWLALTGPAFMYWLLVHVSGIPLLEAHMMRSRPEAFAEYRRRVPPFFPRLGRKAR